MIIFHHYLYIYPIIKTFSLYNMHLYSMHINRPILYVKYTNIYKTFYSQN